MDQQLPFQAVAAVVLTFYPFLPRLTEVEVGTKSCSKCGKCKPAGQHRI